MAEQGIIWQNKELMVGLNGKIRTTLFINRLSINLGHKT